MSGDRWSRWVEAGCPKPTTPRGEEKAEVTPRTPHLKRTVQAGVYVYTGGTIKRAGGGVFGTAVLVRRDPPSGGSPRWLVGPDGGPVRVAPTMTKAEEIAAEIVAGAKEEER